MKAETLSQVHPEFEFCVEINEKHPKENKGYYLELAIIRQSATTICIWQRLKTGRGMGKLYNGRKVSVKP